MSERQPTVEGANSAGAWLELSVEADVEAVEAVSEILGRVAPGGTSIEPAFELAQRFNRGCNRFFQRGLHAP